MLFVLGKLEMINGNLNSMQKWSKYYLELGGCYFKTTLLFVINLISNIFPDLFCDFFFFKFIEFFELIELFKLTSHLRSVKY